MAFGKMPLAAMLATMLFAGVDGAFAQSAPVSLGIRDHDSSAPIEITSAAATLDRENGKATFEGDVIVRQGGITMKSDRVIVEYSDDREARRSEISFIRMFGAVTFVSSIESAEADSAVYTPRTDTLRMDGNVLITQGQTSLLSDQMTYNLATGDGRMEGRVRSVLRQETN